MAHVRTLRSLMSASNEGLAKEHYRTALRLAPERHVYGDAALRLPELLHSRGRAKPRSKTRLNHCWTTWLLPRPSVFGVKGSRYAVARARLAHAAGEGRRFRLGMPKTRYERPASRDTRLRPTPGRRPPRRCRPKDAQGRCATTRPVTGVGGRESRLRQCSGMTPDGVAAASREWRRGLGQLMAAS